MKNRVLLKTAAILLAVFMTAASVPLDTFAADSMGNASATPDKTTEADRPTDAEPDGAAADSAAALETIKAVQLLAENDGQTPGEEPSFVLEDVLATTPTDSGTCGTNVNWAFYESVGLLYISGAGEMADYVLAMAYDNPWVHADYAVSIQTVIISGNVTSIGRQGFSGFSNLTHITIPDSVTSIGKGAFNECSSLSRIAIPDSLTSIGEYAFYGCTGLTSITIPDSVTSIGSSAFDGCTGLTSITIPNSVTSIGRSAFRGCTGLTTITIPDSVTSIGNSAFYVCTGLTSITIPNSVTSIGDYAFYGCTGLTNITIPNSVTIIGDFAFYRCTGLTTITIPDSVTSIGSSAFDGCTGLTSITISDSVTSIGSYAFFGCTGLTGITIPDSVTSIGNSAFYVCTGLTSITIPNSVTSIGNFAFYGCTGLTSITIPNSVTSIGSSAFDGCTRLTSITIPDSVTSIGSSAFDRCTGLTSITIPDGVTSIGTYAFRNCTGLTSITIPDSVTSIGNSSFSGCSCLDTVYYQGSWEEWSAITIGTNNEPLLNCVVINPDTKTLTHGTPGYTIPSDGSILHIAPNAFAGCSGLTSIDVPACVESIGAGAFANCPHLYKAVIRNPDCAVDPTAFDTSVTKVIQYAAVGKAGDTATWYAYKDDSFKEFQYYSVVIEGKGVLDSELTQKIRNKLPTPYISSLTVSEGITGIPDEAFSNWNLLQRVQLADSVRNIGSGVFNSEMLTSIYFDGGRPLMAADAITLAMNNQLGKLTLHYNTDTPRWTYSNIPYRSFVPGVGFSTAEADENSYPLTAFVDYQILDSTWHDENGVCYQVDNDNNTHTARITGFAGGTARVVIPSTVIYAASEYPVVAIADTAFNDIIGLRTITLPASVTTVTGTPVMDCPDLEYVFFKGAIPSGFNMVNTPAYAVIIDEAETNGYGGTVYTASPLTDGIDAQGIVYTVDPAAHTAIVGRLSSGTDNAVNTSGFTGTDAHIPDFVLHNNEVFKVVGFDRCAFYGNKTVQTVTFGRFIGEGQTDEKPGIWDCTFRNMQALTAINVDPANAYYGNRAGIANEGVLFAKSSSYTVQDEDGNPVTDVTLGDSVLTNRLMVYPVGKTDSSYTIPNNITVIERYAFAGNPYLKSVDLNGVTVVGSHAFYNVTGLTDIGTCYQLVYVEDSAFENTVLETVSLTPSLVGIGARAFYKTNLKGTISLYDNIGHIGDGAFGRCTQISAFELKTPEAIEAAYVPAYTVLDGVLFARDGEALRLIQYPAQKKTDDPLYDMSDMPVTAIAADAFYGTRYLQEIIMSDETVTVGSYAFADCANLRHVHIGKSYHGSGEGEDGLFSYGLFWSSTALEFISVDNENKDFCTDNNGVLYAKDKKTLYAYPAGLTRVSYTVPAEVERIYSLAFAENTNVKQVIVAYTGDTFTVGDMAFSNCTSLEEVYWYTGRVPMAGAKIYDGTPVGTFKTYCKSAAHASGWSNVSLWQERPVVSFDSIRPVVNDSVKTDDYTLVIRDTSAKPVTGVSVFLTYTADGRQYYFDAVSDDNGILSISFESGTIDKTIHVYLSHPDYISCDFDVILDMSMMITYLTMYKQPTVIGIALNDKDINSQSAVLNMAEYGEKVSYTLEIEGLMKQTENVTYLDENGEEKTVTIRVQGIWDNGFGDPTYVLKQGDNVLATADSATSVNAEIIDGVCVFTVPVRQFVTDKELYVDMTVSRNGKEASCSSVLHIQVINFTVDADDISVNDPPLPLDFSEVPVLGQLIGNGRSFEFGKHVSFAVTVDGPEVKLSAKYKGSKKLVENNDFKEGYNENHSGSTGNTYFFQFYDQDTGCTYNIRFARGTEEYDYFYYRIYVYKGSLGVKNGDKVIEDWGGVNTAVTGTGHGKTALIPLAVEIYTEAKIWIIRDLAEKALGLAGHDLPKDQKQGPYMPLRMSYKQSDTDGDTESSLKLSFELGGSLTFEYRTDHRLHHKGGSINGSLKLTAQNSTQYVIWIVPVTVDVQITIEGKLDISFKFNGDSEKNKIDFDTVKATVSLELGLSAGIGCSVASFGIFGNAGTVVVFQLYPWPESFKKSVEFWEVHGELGLYAKVLGFKKTLRLLPFKKNAPATLYIIDNRPKMAAPSQPLLLSPAAMNEYTVRAMLYMSGEWDAQGDCAELPRLVSVNGTEYVFYMTNVGPTAPYDAYNNMKLVYARVVHYADGSIGLDRPVIVDDNGYIDSAFDLTVSGDCVYVALTQQTNRMDETTAEDPYALAEGLSIKLLTLVDENNEIVVYNNDLVVDGSEQSDYKYLTSVAFVNGQPVIVWAQNADNNIFGASPFNRAEYVYDTDENGDEYISEITTDVYNTISNSVWISRHVYDSWRTECLTDKLSSVTDLTIAPNGTVYYVMDADGDLADDSDKRLFTVTPGGTPVMLEEAGTVQSVNVVNGNVMYYSTDAGLVPVSGSMMLPESTKMPAGEYKLILGDGGRAVLLYTQNKTRTADDGSEYTCTVLYGLFRKDETAAWGEPVAVYDPAANNQYIADYDAIFTTDENLMAVVSLCNEDGENSGRKTFVYDPSGVNLSFSDLTVNYAAGTVSFTIRNAGAGEKTLNVNGTPYTVTSGKELTVTEVPQDGCVTVTDDTGCEFMKYTEISMDYVDLEVLTKQTVIGDNNMLIIAIRNNGNTDAKDIPIYVSRSVTEVGGDMVSSVEAARSEANALAQMTAACIKAGQTVYYEVVLDHSLIENGDGVVTVYAAPQLHDDEIDNLSALFLGEIAETVIGHDEAALSAETVTHLMGDTTDLTVTVLNRLNPASGVTVIGTVGNTETELVEGKDYTFDKETGRLTLLGGHSEEKTEQLINTYLADLLPDDDSLTLPDGDPEEITDQSINTYLADLLLPGNYPLIIQCEGRTMTLIVNVLEGSTIQAEPSNPGEIPEETEPVTQHTVTWVYLPGVTQCRKYLAGTALVNDTEFFNGKEIIGWDMDNDGAADELGTVSCDMELTAVYKTERIRGDVNGDGILTTVDVAMMNAYVRGLLAFDEEQLACADMIGTDGRITTVDVARLNAIVRNNAS